MQYKSMTDNLQVIKDKFSFVKEENDYLIKENIDLKELFIKFIEKKIGTFEIFVKAFCGDVEGTEISMSSWPQNSAEEELTQSKLLEEAKKSLATARSVLEINVKISEDFKNFEVTELEELITAIESVDIYGKDYIPPVIVAIDGG